MKNYIKNLFDEFTQKSSNWDTEVSEYLDNDDESGKKSFDQLIEVLTQFISLIRDDKVTKEYLEQLFIEYKHYKSYKYIITFVWNRISIYSDYSPLREAFRLDKFKAQKILEIIWEEYIYRLNPYLNWKDKLVIEDDSIYENLANRLGKYVSRSVRYSLTYEAMVDSLKKESELPEELCRYIAKRIDENMKELKINYIIDRLVRIEDNIGQLLEDESTDE